jgi:hypothetical protein
MSGLITDPNIECADNIYSRLIDLHAGKTGAESMRINARLILTLVNHIGDEQAIFEAMEIAGRARVQGNGAYPGKVGSGD